MPVVTGETGGDDALLKSFGDEAVGLVSSCPYTLDLDTDGNKRFVDGMVKNYNVVPGLYAGLLYVNGMVINAALKGPAASARQGRVHESAEVGSLTDTPRGPIKFDHLNNVVGNFYIRRMAKSPRAHDRNKTVKTYENVSQFWTCPEQEFLAQPVYSRDYPATDPRADSPNA